MDHLRIVGIVLNIAGLLLIGACDSRRTNCYSMVTAFLFAICNLWLFVGPALTRLISRLFTNTEV
jgi:hypothetical protein